VQKHQHKNGSKESKHFQGLAERRRVAAATRALLAADGTCGAVDELG